MIIRLFNPRIKNETKSPKIDKMSVEYLRKRILPSNDCNDKKRGYTMLTSRFKRLKLTHEGSSVCDRAGSFFNQELVVVRTITGLYYKIDRGKLNLLRLMGFYQDQSFKLIPVFPLIKKVYSKDLFQVYIWGNLVGWGEFLRIYGIWKDNICSICLDKRDGKKFDMQTSCNHYFHQQCVKEWIETKGTCPCCRYKLKDVKSGNDESFPPNYHHGESSLNITIGIIGAPFGQDSAFSVDLIHRLTGADISYSERVPYSGRFPASVSASAADPEPSDPLDSIRERLIQTVNFEASGRRLLPSDFISEGVFVQPVVGRIQTLDRRIHSLADSILEDVSHLMNHLRNGQTRNRNQQTSEEQTGAPEWYNNEQVLDEIFSSSSEDDQEQIVESDSELEGSEESEADNETSEQDSDEQDDDSFGEYDGLNFEEVANRDIIRDE